MTRFHLNFGGRKWEVSIGLVDKSQGTTDGRHIFVNSVRLMGIGLTASRVMDMFDECSRQSSSNSLLFAGAGALCAGCKILASHLDEEEEWRA